MATQLATCRGCGQDKICNGKGLCGNCQFIANTPVVVCIHFTNSVIEGVGPRQGSGIPAAQHATAALRRHGITRPQVLAVNAVVYHVPSQRDPVEHLYYTLEVPAHIADALAAETAGR